MLARMWRRRMLVGSCVVTGLLGAGIARAAQPADGSPEPFVEEVSGTSVTFRMVPVPAGKDGATLWFSETEVTWELYDIFVFGLDEPAGSDGDGGTDGGEEADAVSRPSKPYLPPDRGYGHDGYPAISMTYEAATKLCEWLTEKTGRTYRLPTPEEWRVACLAGSEPPYCYDEAGESLDAYAWSDENAEFSTHPVAKKRPNAWGLYDTHGNVAEWVVTKDKYPMAMGGSFREVGDKCKADSKQWQNPTWNASDPQIPKSSWWLADCGWVGIRLVCEDATKQDVRQGD